MATKYDVFEVVYAKRTPMKPKDIASKLGKGRSEYNRIIYLLNILVKEKLLVKTKYGFQGKVSPKASQLFRMIEYFSHNNLSYNFLIDTKVVHFLSMGLKYGIISAKRCKLNPRTFKNYVNVLGKYGLLLIISKKPLHIKVFYNSIVKNLLTYFDFKPQIKDTKSNFIDEITKELKRFKTLKKREASKYRKIVDELEISFVHHSLSLEGNPITLPDTYMILKKKVIPQNLREEDVDEVRNYQQAILKMLEDSANKEPLTFQAILRYHEMAMAHHPDFAGKIRVVGVHIRGNPDFKVGQIGEIEKKLEILLEKYNDFVSKKKKSVKEILSFATYFHSEFQHIHPFKDGNSRTTRLLTFYIFQAEDIPVIDMPLGLLDEYILNTKKAKKRDDEQLFYHLQRLVLFNLKMINHKLKT